MLRVRDWCMHQSRTLSKGERYQGAWEFSDWSPSASPLIGSPPFYFNPPPNKKRIFNHFLPLAFPAEVRKRVSVGFSARGRGFMSVISRLPWRRHISRMNGAFGRRVCYLPSTWFHEIIKSHQGVLSRSLQGDSGGWTTGFGWLRFGSSSSWLIGQYCPRRMLEHLKS